MTSGPAETPRDWMTTSAPLSARFTGAVSSASPAIFSNLGRSIGILRADRASARTEWPASRAAFTVSRPIPLLAPMMRTVATASCSTARTRLAHHHVRYRQQHRKIGERLADKAAHALPAPGAAGAPAPPPTPAATGSNKQPPET